MRSKIHDTTSLGCAIAAGLAEGIDLVDLSPQNRGSTVKIHRDTFLPTTTEEDRKPRQKKWKMAVERSMGWEIIHHDTTMTGNLSATCIDAVLCCANHIHLLHKKILILVISSSDERFEMLSSIPFAAFFISSFGLLVMSEILNWVVFLRLVLHHI